MIKIHSKRKLISDFNLATYALGKIYQFTLNQETFIIIIKQNLSIHTKPRKFYQWLPRRFNSWHLHRDIHLCLRGKVVLMSVPPIIYKNWSQTRFKMGKMPLGMKVFLSNLPFTNYLKLKFHKFIINKLQV